MLDERRLEEVHAQVRVFRDLDFDAMPADELRTRTMELVMVLPAHFAAEVAPGAFFDKLRERLPGRHADIQRLVRDHLHLLGEADHLLDALEARPLDAALRAGIRRFAAHLARHEFEEGALAAESAWRADRRLDRV